MTPNSSRVLKDREPFRLPDNSISGEGYLTISARVARTGIQTYYGHELVGTDGVEPERTYKVYRPEAEVFGDEVLESFDGLPITFGHPAQGIHADNYRDHAVGHVANRPVRDGNFVRATLTIRDASSIAKIKSGEATQISVGYHADVNLEAGTTSLGEAYDAIQSHIRGNHIALVDAARCGPECRIGDSLVTDCACASCQTHKGQFMSETLDMVLLDGEQIPLGEAVTKLKDANARMAEALKDAETTIEAMSSELETKKGEVEAMKHEPTGDSTFAAKVQARAQMLSEATGILGDEPELSSQSDTDIRRKVIDHIYGDGFAKGASVHALIGMYKVAVRDSAQGADSLNGVVAPTSTNQTQLQAASTRRNERLRNAWRANSNMGGA